MILAFAVFRVRGDYLAIVTLGFGIIIKIIAINFPSITNGSRGLVDIPQLSTIYWTGGVAVVAVVLILNIVYSKYGRAMKAIIKASKDEKIPAIIKARIKEFECIAKIKELGPSKKN